MCVSVGGGKGGKVVKGIKILMSHCFHSFINSALQWIKEKLLTR